MLEALARVLGLWIPVASLGACALENRAAARFVDPSLRERGIAYDSVQGARSIEVGPWELRRWHDAAIPPRQGVPSATFDEAAIGRAEHRERYGFRTIDVETGEVAATSSCESARRQGPEAALASAAELPSDEVALSCAIETNGVIFSLELRGRLDQNLLGAWSQRPLRALPADTPSERAEGRVEVLLHHQIWGRVPARTPAAVVQLFWGAPRPEPIPADDATAPSNRAVAAANLDRHGTVWMARSLDEITAIGAVSILGALVFAPFPWEQAS